MLFFIFLLCIMYDRVMCACMHYMRIVVLKACMHAFAPVAGEKTQPQKKRKVVVVKRRVQRESSGTQSGLSNTDTPRSEAAETETPTPDCTLTPKGTPTPEGTPTSEVHEQFSGWGGDSQWRNECEDMWELWDWPPAFWRPSWYHDAYWNPQNAYYKYNSYDWTRWAATQDANMETPERAKQVFSPSPVPTEVASRSDSGFFDDQLQRCSTGELALDVLANQSSGQTKTNCNSDNPGKTATVPEKTLPATSNGDSTKANNENATPPAQQQAAQDLHDATPSAPECTKAKEPNTSDDTATADPATTPAENTKQTKHDEALALAQKRLDDARNAFETSGDAASKDQVLKAALAHKTLAEQINRESHTAKTDHRGNAAPENHDMNKYGTANTPPASEKKPEAAQAKTSDQTEAKETPQTEKTPEELAMEKKQKELKKKKDEAHARYMRYYRSVRSTILSTLCNIMHHILNIARYVSLNFA